MTAAVRSIVLSWLLAANAVFAGEIREFDLKTTERLGNELAYRDHLAAQASDLVLSQHPELKKVGLQSWVSDLHKDGDLVYWSAETKNGLAPEYKVTFLRSSAPRIEDIRGQPLPAAIVTRFHARQTGMQAALPKLNGAYGAHYNFEVLNDPDSSGFLVYGLAATNKPGEQLLGGHVRVTVSANGSKAEHVDELSKGIMKFAPIPTGAREGVIGTYDPISNVPVETYIYSSKLYNMPIFVGPKPGVYWQIWNGKMHKLTKSEIDQANKETKKK
jgi:hypothetical protein